ncbi:MIP family Ig-specific serine endopeptidase [Mycoplasma nasistruthionis]|uniref:DUF31 domain-containing protein n=1 Tax=Mycoplasma nasistruthionis TaxID=353852 RepID=A0A4Y6I6M0_9MOLU|nr:hypothetical protein [Mycoplasma nasistruthionis]QDF65032.1 hypothetical protein FIV53_01835 [Mycoplasma nasistruthionis]
MKKINLLFSVLTMFIPFLASVSCGNNQKNVNERSINNLPILDTNNNLGKISFKPENKADLDLSEFNRKLEFLKNKFTNNDLFQEIILQANRIENQQSLRILNSKSDELINLFLEAKNILKTKLNQLLNRINNIQASIEINLNQTLINDLNILNTDIEALKYNQIQDAFTKFTRYENYLNIIENKLVELVRKIKEFESLNQNIIDSNLSEKYLETTSQIKSWKSEILELDLAENHNNKLIKTIDHFREKYQEVISKLSTVRADIIGLKEQINSLNLTNQQLINEKINLFSKQEQISQYNLQQLIDYKNQLNDFILKVNQNTNANIENQQTNDQILSDQEIQNYYANNPDLKYYHDTQIDNSLLLSNNSEYINMILNRSYTLTWQYLDGTTSGGTAWILDFAKLDNNNNYKLFLATNYHVAVDIYSQNDYTMYKQPNRLNNPIKHFGIGIDLQNTNNPDILNIVNKYHLQNKKYAYRFFTPTAMPKTFFLAQNFMDNISDLNENYYTDFAVLELNINLSDTPLSLSDFDNNSPLTGNNANLEWKLVLLHLQNAIKLLEKQNQKLSNSSVLVNTNNNKYANVNFDDLYFLRRNILNIKNKPNMPIFRDVLQDALDGKADTINKINSLNDNLKSIVNSDKYKFALNTYFAGFPNQNGSISTVSNLYDDDKNNLNFSINRPFFLPDTTYNNTVVANRGTEFNKMGQSKYYGVIYKGFSPNKVIGGMSGSLVLDSQTLPTGIIWGQSPTSNRFLLDNGKNINLYTPLMASFVQNREFESNNLKVFSYDLIDGTDIKYIHQRYSYKHALNQNYPELSTLLFPKNN